jgi:hypothetical protein
VTDGRIAVWSQRENGQWRVHSTFKVLHTVTAIDFVQGASSEVFSPQSSVLTSSRQTGKIVAAGEGVSLWEVDESSGFPVWSRIGSLSYATLFPFAATRAHVALLQFTSTRRHDSPFSIQFRPRDGYNCTRPSSTPISCLTHSTRPFTGKHDRSPSLNSSIFLSFVFSRSFKPPPVSFSSGALCPDQEHQLET